MAPLSKYDYIKIKFHLKLGFLISWHLISVIVLLMSLISSCATSNDVDDGLWSSGKNDMMTDELSTTTPESLPVNESTEGSFSLAADCSVNVEVECPKTMKCSQLSGYCLDCAFNLSCPYGSKQKAQCTPKTDVICDGPQTFEREYECRYCYQLPEWMTWCNQTMDCALNKPRNHYPARPYFVSTCWAGKEHLCMGRRCFHKQLSCNWSRGYKWSTAMLLSIFLGGFGVDRFYLGLWKEGIGKLISFGGLGVWTLVDVILIGVGYVGPWDGSLYI